MKQKRITVIQNSFIFYEPTYLTLISGLELVYEGSYAFDEIH